MNKRKPPVYDAEFFEQPQKRQRGLGFNGVMPIARAALVLFWIMLIALAALMLFWIGVLGLLLT